MKAAIFSLLMLGFIAVQAQTPLPPLDKSPMDMSYYPVNYPILKIQHKADAPLIARVIYGGLRKITGPSSETSFHITVYGAWEPMRQRRLNFSGT